ncbi:hypothetical protein SMACR_07322 [Sordaria macrospora]|uniref:WGS project CABT00000000 data, contig 2.44 n=2 Tax=Sordaria macrospora TaxID=5147 RepID=F7W8G8_SORMK|nr:uncharacterized protein SMAC_07322 [Sordaria macrospora k-hell]KAA8628669.1 hypothetical protein SMACR_07322 [Sordaria macrospora]KAH7625378.1 hypothetical protein B0T09DRAFT_274206 [Sordaria sp. MPI-SDFR-AT-0083]WPJ62641.1 hypothetical protein SMAC4_07322 [Sordaria macrospora]CCC13813.1 unnamed protein product [Sordaria macrospora k-hell]
MATKTSTSITSINSTVETMTFTAATIIATMITSTIVTVIRHQADFVPSATTTLSLSLSASEATPATTTTSTLSPSISEPLPRCVELLCGALKHFLQLCIHIPESLPRRHRHSPLPHVLDVVSMTSSG